MHYEAELVVVIGKQARKRQRSRCHGLCRGLHRVLTNYVHSRLSWKTTTALTLRVKRPRRTDADASTIVPKEAIPDPHNLTLRTFVNGELRQQGTTAGS